MSYYLGKRSPLDWVLFQSGIKPTRQTHEHLFKAVIGPFRTKAAASFFHRYGRGNPHILTVEDAERLVRQEATDGHPVAEQLLVEETMTAEELNDARAFEQYERTAEVTTILLPSNFNRVKETV